MKLTTPMACGAVVMLAACASPQDMVDRMEFVQHKQTGLCFAAIHTDAIAWTQVPCTPEVLAIINDQATAPPVVEEEISR